MLPVIGVPVQTKALSGVDSLYSIVQMPKGYPVATMAIGAAGAANAGLMAAGILALNDPALAARLDAWRDALTPRSRMSRKMTDALPPGATIGILGGGQLGRMLSVAAARAWLQAPISSNPAQTRPPPMWRIRSPRPRMMIRRRLRPLPHRSTSSPMSLRIFRPTRLICLEKSRPIRPNRRALAISQDRILEKDFLTDLGLTTAPYAAVQHRRRNGGGGRQNRHARPF